MSDETTGMPMDPSEEQKKQAEGTEGEGEAA